MYIYIYYIIYIHPLITMMVNPALLLVAPKWYFFSHHVTPQHFQWSKLVPLGSGPASGAGPKVGRSSPTVDIGQICSTCSNIFCKEKRRWNDKSTNFNHIFRIYMYIYTASIDIFQEVLEGTQNDDWTSNQWCYAKPATPSSCATPLEQCPGALVDLSATGVEPVGDRGVEHL